MADQNTTVAALPAGYATLAGVIYAVAASSSKIWGHIAWARMSQVSLGRAVPTNDQVKGTGVGGVTKKSSKSNVESAFTKTISREMRKLGPARSDMSLGEYIAALHLLCSKANTEPAHVSHDGDSSIIEGNSESLPSGEELTNRGSSNAVDESVTFPEIVVVTVDHCGKQRETWTVVGLTPAKLRTMLELMASAELHSESRSVTEESMISIANHTKSEEFARIVFVQAAASYEAVITEIVYKAIELIFACAVILGSSGGAWLGFSLGSMFPQRVAAGLFVSSYGQALSRGQIATQKTPHTWRAAGTVWTEGSNPYSIPPAGLSDAWRNAMGYTLQYLVLIVVQLFKLRIRDALQFAPYLITRDAIRYILLVIQLFALIICGTILRNRFKNSRARRRDVIAGTVYSITLAAGLTCVILGQKSFLKPIWKFYLASRIVDPIAAVGSIAAMKIDWQENGKVLPEKWVLLWIMGACTVVW